MKPDIYNTKTVFPLYEYETGLSDEQKALVIRDNAMALLSSQGPILPADAVESTIIGNRNESCSFVIRCFGNLTSIRPSEISQTSIENARSSILSGQPVANKCI